MSGAVRVALIGANGFGLQHRRAIHRLQQSGRVRLVAIANRRPVAAADGAPLDGVAVFDDSRIMLARCEPDITVIATPPHTHLGLAAESVRAGSDVLVEKPPVVTLDEYASLIDLVHQHEARCQVGFQALGSRALPALVSAVRGGALGEVTAIGCTGSWWRPDSYYRRSPWAGRRTIEGCPTGDGVLSNQFAHGLAQALVFAAQALDAVPEAVEVERYRTRDIEVEDTARLTVTLTGGRRIQVAVTVASDRFTDGTLTFFGGRGQARWQYRHDRIEVGGDPARRIETGRAGLLENLLDHRDDPRVPLVAPLSATHGFVAVLDALHRSPAPAAVPAAFLRPHPGGDGSVVDRINGVLAESHRRRVSLAEAGAPWAVPPFRTLVCKC
ncbi:Gfo/Idh/MocA family oxidoreductase [Micromonospora sp. NPDC049240]|uniref:Gfo/Idh/MocA family protein n=1 Tax=Micromonospora sp. NPDC049240 TaxID=3155151 RepID=UPI0033C72845